MSAAEELAKMVNEHLGYVSNDIRELKDQVVLTNGRLRKLEMFKSNLIYVTGACVILFAFMIAAANLGWVDAVIKFGK
jgi:hypothetical protein